MTTTKVALITGAAHRIGAALSRAFHQAGYQLVLHYGNSAEAANTLAEELNQQRPDSARTLQADLRQTEAVQNLAQQAQQCWGHVDVLINNASRFYPVAVDEVTAEQWQDLMGSNVKAPFFLSQALMTTLKQRQGCIINLVDIYAERPLAKHAVYSTSKAAIAMLTKTLAQELGPEIRVNGISPGAILWPNNDNDAIAQQALLEKTALKRIGSPDDICQAALYLANASYVTGQIIAVDGGRSLNQ